MNNSKKLKAQKVKEVKISEKPLTSISKPWLITGAVLIILLIGALLFDQLYQATLMTIDGKKYHMKELSYYFYNTESSYAYYDQMLAGQYWNMTADQKKGTTMRDVAKQDAIDLSLKNEIVYNEAVAQGYKLTTDEKSQIKSKVDNLLSQQIPKAVIDKNHFTRSYLTMIINKQTLANRYRQDLIKTLNIDKDKIKAGVKYEDFRQYNIEYIYAPTQTTDKDGKTVDISADEQTKLSDKILSYLDKAKATKDWSKLVPTSETDLRYKEGKFVYNDNTFSKDFEAVMMKMNNGDVSDVYKDTTGYYIVRMVDNNNKDSYNTEVNNKITEAENNGFDKLYKSKIEPKHKYTLNKKALGKLTMGTITLVQQ